MGYVTRNGETIIKERTKDGEITINLVLTIKLDGDGISISGEPIKKDKPILDLNEEKDTKVDLEIPDFNDDTEMIDFGKDI